MCLHILAKRGEMEIFLTHAHYIVLIQNCNLKICAHAGWARLRVALASRQARVERTRVSSMTLPPSDGAPCVRLVACQACSRREELNRSLAFPCAINLRALLPPLCSLSLSLPLARWEQFSFDGIIPRAVSSGAKIFRFAN